MDVGALGRNAVSIAGRLTMKLSAVVWRPRAGVVGDELDVVVGVGLTAGPDLAQHDLVVLGQQLEVRLSPHLPVGVARVGVVGVLDAHRPPLVQRVADLRGDLLVGEVGEEREGSLGDAHG